MVVSAINCFGYWECMIGALRERDQLCRPALQAKNKDQMIKQYLTEIILGLAVGFMAFYPPHIGVFLFVSALGLIAGFKLIEKKENPDVRKLKEDVKEMKSKIEQLILGRSR